MKISTEMPFRSQRSRQSGLSLVELMVGITIGLIVVAAASLMMSNQVAENSRLLAETQLQQDLRAAADLMLRDIRRAGYNKSASTTVWAPTTTSAVPINIYAPTSPAVVEDHHFYYAYCTSGTCAGASSMPLGLDSYGFRLETRHSNKKGGDVGVLYSVNGTAFDTASPQVFQFASGATPTMQPLTDPESVDITQFDITLTNQGVPATAFTNPPCDPAATNCPCLVVRRVDVTITGQSLYDTKVKRTLQISSRIRNDQLVNLPAASCT
ncbi:PilW family protein [Pelomonas sp. KK5]|uniref:PilW family protein n=1 Tax=Pelomonas sp. KK5 TaxID=1855730 RepID=UPI00097BDB19|nr:prepilin-type N-terminal cleavage/methylation domain-containing protein [Pelomonas sp. KK5]